MPVNPDWRFRARTSARPRCWGTRQAGSQSTESSPPAHAYSPFQLHYLEPRDYWIGFTEYLRAPGVLHFGSLPDLLLEDYLRQCKAFAKTEVFVTLFTLFR